MTNDRVNGKGQEVVGGLKEEAGKAIGDQELEAEGTGQKTAGKARKAVGELKDKLNEVKDKVT